MDLGKRLILLMIIVLCSAALLSDEASEYRIRSIDFSGNSYYSDGKLRSMMESRSKNLMEKIFFWRKAPVFNVNILENDLNRIVSNYQRVGFMDAGAVIEELTRDENKQQIRVTVAIEEGIRTRVSRIDFTFTDSDESFGAGYLSSLQNELSINEDSFFTDNVFKEDLEAISTFFDAEGYPYIKVDYRLSLEESENEVSINYLVTTGPKSYFGETVFMGLEKADENLLRKHLSYKEGMVYSRKQLGQTRYRLQSLGMFQYVSINVRLDGGGEIVPVEIALRESDTISTNFGFGYGLEDRFRIYTDVTKQRFLGGLRRGNIFIKHSYLEPIKIDFKLTQPAFPTIRTTLILNPFYRIEREPGYEIERVGSNVTLNHRISSITSTYLTYTFENNKLDRSADFNPDLDELDSEKLLRSYRKSSVSWGVLRDSSEPRFFPRQGMLLSNTITLSGLGFGSNFRFLRLVPEARYYQSLGRYFVVASKVKLGYLKSISGDDYIPIEDRFYAGGSYSVRGWGRSRLGPITEENRPKGGNSLIEGSVELRYPIWAALTGVLFIDYGNVWRETAEYDLRDLHYALGTGFRYATPFGPVRLDFGYPISDSSESMQFFISLGQAF